MLLISLQRYKLSMGGWGSKPVVITRVRAPTILHVFVFLSRTSNCRLYKFTLSDHAQGILQLIIRLSDFV